MSNKIITVVHVKTGNTIQGTESFLLSAANENHGAGWIESGAAKAQVWLQKVMESEIPVKFRFRNNDFTVHVRWDTEHHKVADSLDCKYNCTHVSGNYVTPYFDGDAFSHHFCSHCGETVSHESNQI